MFVVLGKSFPIHSATFSAIVYCDEQADDGNMDVLWTFDIVAEPAEIDGAIWRPNLHLEDVRVEINDPLLLEFAQVPLLTIDDYCELSLGEKASVTRLNLQFGERHGDTYDALMIGGLWDNETAEEENALRIMTHLQFRGLRIFRQTTEEARGKLGELSLPEEYDVRPVADGFLFTLRSGV